MGILLPSNAELLRHRQREATGWLASQDLYSACNVAPEAQVSGFTRLVRSDHTVTGWCLGKSCVVVGMPSVCGPGAQGLRTCASSMFSTIYRGQELFWGVFLSLWSLLPPNSGNVHYSTFC